MKLSVFICLLAVASKVQAFRFEGQAEVEKAPEVAPIEAEEPQEEKQREEKKIDPLVVDIDRRPVEAEEAKEAKEGPSEGEAEGRFFLKDKLCALGLADVSSKIQRLQVGLLSRGQSSRSKKRNRDLAGLSVFQYY